MKHFMPARRARPGLLCALFALAACGGSAGNSTGNLILDGNAEAATGSTDASPVTVPDWTSSGEATALQYGVSGYPAATDPGPTDRGMNLFIGGQDDEASTLTQSIDVGQYASAIDGGGVTYALSGWLGGYAGQEDSAAVAIVFQDASSAALGAGGSIGPVTAEDRNSTTELLQRTANGSVPVGTRHVVVTVTMTRTEGTANDGYADDLSLVFHGI